MENGFITEKYKEAKKKKNGIVSVSVPLNFKLPQLPSFTRT